MVYIGELGHFGDDRGNVVGKGAVAGVSNRGRQGFKKRVDDHNEDRARERAALDYTREDFVEVNLLSVSEGDARVAFVKGLKEVDQAYGETHSFDDDVDVKVGN